jgi:hypothetical protein
MEKRGIIMQDIIRFNNDIHYLVVSPDGSIAEEGKSHNQTGYFVKDAICRAFTTPSGVSPGTVTQICNMLFRADGSAILGSFNQWVMTGSAYSTRYNSATAVTSVGFNGTFQATANVTVKTVALGWRDFSGFESDLVGGSVHFYSTNLNMSVGSAGKIIIQWTVTA